MVFKFKALSAEDDTFIRDYELRYDATLLDFHKFICEDLGFDEEEMASFFLSNDAWVKQREFTLVDMEEEAEDGPVSMDSVFLSNIVRQKCERLIYTYDLLNDRSLFIQLIESHTGNKNIDYPAVTLSEGVAPAQFGEEREGAIYEEMMSEFGDDYDDSYDDYGFDDYNEGGGGYDDGYGGYDDEY